MFKKENYTLKNPKTTLTITLLVVNIVMDWLLTWDQTRINLPMALGSYSQIYPSSCQGTF